MRTTETGRNSASGYALSSVAAENPSKGSTLKQGTFSLDNSGHLILTTLWTQVEERLLKNFLTFEKTKSISKTLYRRVRQLTETTESQPGVVERATAYALEAHGSIDQRRKYSGEPYIVHPAKVAEIVASVTSDEVMIAAAWLHDVVEDTPRNIEEIELEFGTEVAVLVSAVTKVVDAKDFGRKKAVEINNAHVGKGDSRAKTLKLADVIHNLSDIADQNPEIASVYVHEKELLLEVLRDGNPVLFNRAEALIRSIKDSLSDASH
jgi:hypothetical protein